MERNELCAIIEAVLFVAGEPVERAAIQEALEVSDEALDEALQTLEAEYEFGRRGIRLLCFGGHVQLATRPDYAPYVERLLQPIQRQSLSQAALETLAIVAYKQPVTRSEIEAIRGVKCDYSVQSLMQKRLIQEVGRKDSLGRPILYGTTDEFLRHFCIASLGELPEIDLTMPPRAPEEEGEETADAPPAPLEANGESGPDAVTEETGAEAADDDYV